MYKDKRKWNEYMSKYRKKNKVLFIPKDDFTLYELRVWIYKYTLFNGVLPDYIHMNEKGVQNFKSLLKDKHTVKENLEISGVKIKNIDRCQKKKK
jgi:hypothetical protein